MFMMIKRSIISAGGHLRHDQGPDCGETENTSLRHERQLPKHEIMSIEEATVSNMWEIACNQWG